MDDSKGDQNLGQAAKYQAGEVGLRSFWLRVLNALEQQHGFLLLQRVQAVAEGASQRKWQDMETRYIWSWWMILRSCPPW